ncbi:MAG: hypothetical protein HY717_04565, partial [Planctomycetes bacterium]|nr:hypothetical protein [Planctomycetota bacterium]
MGVISASWSHRWPGAVVPYEIAADITMDVPAAQAVLQAISEWNMKTQLQLLVHTGESDSILFTKSPSICASPVGRQGGAQIIGCPPGPGGSITPQTVMHEIGHAIGLWNEQQRRDRDKFVLVDGSVIDGKNYKMKSREEAFHFGLYDCDSIMQYPVIPGNIADRPGGCGPGMGTSVALSSGDIHVVDFYRWEPFYVLSKGAPASASWGPGRVDLFVVGTDNSVYHKWFDGNWKPSLQDINLWEQFAISAKHRPATASWGPGRLDLFAVGSDDAVYHKWFDGSWHPSPVETDSWERFAISAKHGPAAASWGPGRLDLFVVGSDDAVYHKWFQGGWYPSPVETDSWERFAISAKHGPAAASWGPGRLDLFVVGSDDAVYHKWFDGSWHPSPVETDSWERFAISAKHGPAVASWGP